MIDNDLSVKKKEDSSCILSELKFIEMTLYFYCICLYNINFDCFKTREKHFLKSLVGA